MLENTSATPETIVPPVSERRFAIYRNGVLHSMFRGTRANASKHVHYPLNMHPSSD